MKINIDSFETEIDPTILKRGMSYFRKDAVSSFEELENGEYIAEIEGTETYIVKLSIRDNVLLKHSCTCPYDWGPVCKHVAAALFYHQMDVLDLKKPVKKNPGEKKPKAKAKTVKEKFIAKMMRIDPVKFRDYLIELGLENPSFRRQILNHFTELSEGDSIASYKKQLNEVVRANKRQGFIDWKGMGNVGRAFNQILNLAERFIQKRDYMQAINIYLAVIDVANNIVNYCDDSNGEIMDAVYPSFEQLFELAVDGDEKIRKYLYEYSLKKYEAGSYKGWDWHTDMLHLASVTCDNLASAEKILDIMDKNEEGEDMWSSSSNDVYRLELIERFFDKDRSDDFIDQNIDNDRIREIAITRNIENGDFEQAKGLAHDGIIKDKDMPGLVNKWKDHLLEIALLESDYNNILGLARELYIDGYQDKEKYYRILRNTVAPEDWKEFVDLLIEDMSKGSRGSFYHEISSLLIAEERWDELLRRLEQEPYLSYIERSEQYLKDKHPERLATLYVSAIKMKLEQNVGRNHYKEACRYIRRIKKLDQHDIADKLVAELKVLYPQRRALMEELSLV